jgi:hypothetical protein
MRHDFGQWLIAILLGLFAIGCGGSTGKDIYKDKDKPKPTEKEK